MTLDPPLPRHFMRLSQRVELFSQITVEKGSPLLFTQPFCFQRSSYSVMPG
jgi:hypothetical protein